MTLTFFTFIRCLFTFIVNLKCLPSLVLNGKACSIILTLSIAPEVLYDQMKLLDGWLVYHNLIIFAFKLLYKIQFSRWKSFKSGCVNLLKENAWVFQYYYRIHNQFHLLYSFFEKMLVHLPLIFKANWRI